MRLYSRNAYDWTARLSAITSAAARIKAKSFTIDGEAVVEIAQIQAIILDQVEGVEDCGPCCLSAAQLVEP